MIKELQLRLATKFSGQETSKGLKDHSKLLRDQKKDITELGKSQSKVLKDAQRGFGDLGKAARSAGDVFRSAFDAGVSGLNRFNGAIDKFGSKVLNLKNLVAGSLIGGLAIEGAKKALDAGTALLAAKGRIGREFGAEGAGIQALALRVGRNAGLRDEDALRAIIPIAEAVQETQAGVLYRGRRLTAAQAARLRQQTLGFGGNLLQRITTVTGIDAQEAGQLLAEAGSGDQGLRRFAGSLGLNRVFARNAAAANEKGRLFELLGAERAARFGVHRGQVAGQGTLLDVVLSQSGVTDEAAAAKRRSFAFQRKSITSQLDNVLGDIGERALDKLNHGLAKGTTLAEKLQSFLSSERGKQAIDKIATGIERFVDGLIRATEELPKIAGFIEKHKTAFAVVGGGILGARLLGSDTAKGIGALFKGAGKVADLAGSMKPIPVYIVAGPGGGSLPGLGGAGGAGLGLLQKAGLVAGAGAAGFALGSVLDSKLGLSDKISSGVYNTFSGKSRAALEDANAQASQARVERLKQLRLSQIAAYEAQGLTHVQALVKADHPETRFGGAGSGDIVNHVTVQVDGQTVSHHVERHLVRKMKNQTGRGAAPTSRGD